MIPLLPDTQLHIKELKRWTHNETVLIFLEDQVKSCYTMRLLKYEKVISEASCDQNDIGKLICMMLDKVPVDPTFIKLN